jgi:predicted transcriptional regulator
MSSSVTQIEFDDYFRGHQQAHAIQVSCPKRLETPIKLGRLREIIGFSPPQAWVWASDKLLDVLDSEQVVG